MSAGVATELEGQVETYIANKLVKVANLQGLVDKIGMLNIKGELDRERADLKVWLLVKGTLVRHRPDRAYEGETGWEGAKCTHCLVAFPCMEYSEVSDSFKEAK